MKPLADPTVDYAFKHVFGREESKPVLASLLDAVLQPPPGQAIASLEILNPFNDKDGLDDKSSILDIKARNQSGHQFNIEMQIVAHGGFRERVLFYWAKLHQSQLKEADNYRSLRPTISIAFLDAPLFAELGDYHRVFELCERRHRAIFTNQLAVHILELSKFHKPAAELVTPLDRWLFFLRHALELDVTALPEPLDVADVRWALGDLIMISQSDLERERYESRLKMKRDIKAHLDDAREEGLKQGRAEGLEQLRVEVQIARIQSLQRTLRHEATSTEDLRSLSYTDLESFATRLEAEVTAKMPKNV